MSLVRALTRNRAYTEPDAADARLRTRRYSVPYGRVWAAALELAGSLRGWTVVEARPRDGVLAAEARTRLWKFVDDVEIRVSLDEQGLTRVDAVSASRVGSADFGTNARRIAGFLRRLDDRVGGGGR